MTTIITAIITLLVGLLGGAWLRGRLREPQTTPTLELPPPPPEKTAHGHKNDDVADAVEAVLVAADSYGVDPAVVADDLDWLRSDDDV